MRHAKVVSLLSTAEVTSLRYQKSALRWNHTPLEYSAEKVEHDSVTAHQIHNTFSLALNIN